LKRWNLVRRIAPENWFVITRSVLPITCHDMPNTLTDMP